jgi:hypothetical protein
VPVSVDYEGLVSLLGHHDGRLLPFAVRPRHTGADPRPLVAGVRAAIDAANLVAARRSPADATWCTAGDLPAHEVRAELAKGQLTEAEVRRWFADLERALADLDVTVAPLDVGSGGAPDLDTWRGLPPAVTAFVSFTAEVDGRRRTTPRHVVEETADDLAAWSRLPGATTLAWRGATSFVTQPWSAAEELRTGASLDEQHGLWHVTTDPRRARTVDFTFGAKGSLQIVDEMRPPADCLPDLLAGVRILAPHVDYAWVRRATPAGADERDASYILGRPPTEMEEVAAGRRARHLLAKYAVDAYVAQVLTSDHLAQAGALGSYVVEDLGADRYLVVARDPEPWMAGLNPEPGVLERARGELGGSLLTREIVMANP